MIFLSGRWWLIYNDDLLLGINTVELIKRFLKNLRRTPWERHLYKEFSEEFLRAWVNKLKYFRFVRNSGGGFDSVPDKLLVAIKFDDEKSLRSLFESLGISYRVYDEKPPQPKLGEKYKFGDYPYLIQGTEWIEQPSHQKINGIPVFIWASNGQLEITISGPLENKFDMRLTEFENAKELEMLIQRYENLIVDPPRDNKLCICPKYYPEFWTDK